MEGSDKKHKDSSKNEKGFGDLSDASIDASMLEANYSQSHEPMEHGIDYQTNNQHQNKKGTGTIALVAIGSTILFSAYSCWSNVGNKGYSHIKNPVQLTLAIQEFPEIEWKFLARNDQSKEKSEVGSRLQSVDNKGVQDVNPSKQGTVQRLEHKYFTDKDPFDMPLNEWETPSLVRLVPVKGIIEKHAAHYEIDPLWAVMFFSYESLLNPSDYNSYSDDYGMGQIKRDSERLAKVLGIVPEGIFYSPHLNPEKNIFDPETNVIMSMLLHRYNAARHSLSDSDQLYAVYSRGVESLDRNQRPNRISKPLVEGLNSKSDIFAKVIPYFRIPEKDLSRVSNPDARVALEVYHRGGDPKDMYSALLTHFMRELEVHSSNSRVENDARSVLIYDDCVAFAKTLDKAWGIDQTENYVKLKRIGHDLADRVSYPDLEERIDRTYTILNRR